MTKPQLYQKIAKAKENFERVLKSSDNPFFKSKYASLNDLMAAVVPALTAEGLLLLQPVQRDMVTTIILDIETGENISSSVVLPATLTDPQKIGAAITYFRRFSLQSLLGIAAEDDDGNSISEQKPKTTKTETTTLATSTVDPGAFKRPLGKPATETIKTVVKTPVPVTNGAVKTKTWDEDC